ncbi:DUF2326 domain-containing protein [Patescibacteria group bacterium]|nr:DUF2326 domain-containing protein [Patescibacteria group bacterium]
MITLKQLYFEPDTIKGKKINPIVFKKGLNILLGERSDNSEKMNSVGKSLAIEMINYCLFSDFSSRINKIPNDVLSEEQLICLDLEIETKQRIKNITIKRKRNSKSPILLIVDENEQEFEKLDDAKEWFESIIFEGSENVLKPSIRNLLSILIREEKSSFDDILRPFANKKFFNFNDAIKPHLYLFGFDISFIDRMKQINKTITDNEASLRDINRTFKNMGIDVKTVRSYINDLKDKVEKLNFSIEELKPGEGFRQRKEELQDLEYQLESLSALRSSKLLAINRIKKLPQFEKVNPKRVEIIYNTFREGLGDLVKKSLNEVIELHEKIESFQNKIFDQRLETLYGEVHDLDGKITQIDSQISKIYKVLNADKKIDSLKRALKEEKEKNDKLENLVDKYDTLEQKKEEKKTLEINRNQLIKLIDKEILEKKKNIESFENNLKELHQVIAGNSRCQFDIKTSLQAEYIVFDYRIDLDGGSGMDRIRTFMYDILLMISGVTTSRHLGFLIHDNIFPSTGRDDMVRALNFVYDQNKKGKNFQYIVSLNKDEFEAQLDKFEFESGSVTKATFTREIPFLGTQYREI